MKALGLVKKVAKGAAKAAPKLGNVNGKVSQVRRVRNSQRAAKRILAKYESQGLTVSSKLKSIIYDKSTSYTEKQADRMISRMRETEHELGIYRTDRMTGKTYGRVVSLYQKTPVKGPDGKIKKYSYRKRTPLELETLKYKAAFKSAKKILSPGHFADIDRINFKVILRNLEKYGGGNLKFIDPVGEARKEWFKALGIDETQFVSAAISAMTKAPKAVADSISSLISGLIDNPKSSEKFYRDTFGRQQHIKWTKAMQINPKFKDISPATFDRMEKFFRSKAGRIFMKRVAEQVDSETLRIVIKRNDKIDAKLLLEEFDKLNLDPNDPAYAEKLNMAIIDIIEEMSRNAVSANMS